MGIDAAHRLTDQLRRERLVDMETRLASSRRVAFAVLAVALLSSGFELGWWWIAPLLVAAVAFTVSDRYIATSPTPERWAAAGWAISPLMIAVSIALTGGPESPAIGWLALPAVTLAARFEKRGVWIGVAYMTLLMALATVPFDPGAVGANPAILILPYGLVLGCVILSGAVVQSDREHRVEAVIDPLTGTLNRTGLAQRLIELEQQASNDGGSIGFLLGDLDHFKRINDRHGHAVGDQVLRDTAYAIRDTLRAFDLVYRVGGEEFAVLLPRATLADALDVAERLRAAVERCSRPGMPVTMSFGVAATDGGELDFGVLFHEADTALYEAKRAGRNRVAPRLPVAA